MAEPSVFSGVYFGSTLYQYTLFFISIIVALIIGKIFAYLLNVYGKRLAQRTKNEFDDLLIEASQKPILFLAVLIGAYVGVQFLTIPNEWQLTFTNILGLLFIVDLAWFLVRIVDGIVVHFIVPITKRTRSRMDDQLIPIISGGLKAAVVVIAFVVILDNFGYDITAIIAGLGIGGLAIAFAAQQTISDAFGGLSILMSKPFYVGDLISVEGVTGSVEQIGIRHTRIRDAEGRLNVISNSKISAAVVKNWTSEPGRKVRINLGLVYQTKTEKIRQAIALVNQILSSQKNVNQNSIVIGFTEFKDSSLNVYSEFYINETEFKKIIETQNTVNLAIKEAFEKNKIEFAYPTQTIYLVK